MCTDIQPGERRGTVSAPSLNARRAPPPRSAAPLRQVQYNTEAIVPFYTSSNGYGILWDMYSKS